MTVECAVVVVTDGAHYNSSGSKNSLAKNFFVKIKLIKNFINEILLQYFYKDNNCCSTDSVYALK